MLLTGKVAIGMEETFSIRVKNIAIDDAAQTNPQRATVTFELFAYKVGEAHDPEGCRIL